MTSDCKYYPNLGMLRQKSLTVYLDEVKTVMLDNITLVKIYKKKGGFQSLFYSLFGNKYVFVIFLKNDKQIEFIVNQEKLNAAFELKDEIIKRQLTLAE